MKVKNLHVHAEHFGVYGVRKLRLTITQRGHPGCTCTVERLVWVS